MTTEDRVGQPLEFSRALTYSLAVMSLQRPEPRPLTNIRSSRLRLFSARCKLRCLRSLFDESSCAEAESVILALFC